MYKSYCSDFPPTFGKDGAVFFSTRTHSLLLHFYKIASVNAELLARVITIWLKVRT